MLPRLMSIGEKQVSMYEDRFRSLQDYKTTPSTVPIHLTQINRTLPTISYIHHVRTVVLNAYAICYTTVSNMVYKVLTRHSHKPERARVSFHATPIYYTSYTSTVLEYAISVYVAT